MEREILLSIIIPIHNGEKTLNQCLTSVLNSTHKNIELLLINDRSSDDSEKIINQYAENDARIIKLNTAGLKGGLSCARNVGLKHANGEYVTFVDCDDYIVDDIYKKIIDVLKYETIDILDFNFFFNVDGNIIKHNHNSLPQNAIIDEQTIKELILPVLINIDKRTEFFIDNFVWNKIFRKEIILKQSILFDENRLKWEDRPFIINFIKNAHSFYSLSDYGYYYNCCSNTNHVSQKFDSRLLNVIADSINEYKELFKNDYNFYSDYSVKYYCNLLIQSSLEIVSHKTNSKEDVISIFNSVYIDDTITTMFSLYTPTNIKHIIFKRQILNRTWGSLFNTMDKLNKYTTWKKANPIIKYINMVHEFIKYRISLLRK